MHTIGIDPGLSSTGVVALDDNDELFGSINITHDVRKIKAGKIGIFSAKWIDKPKDAKALKFRYQYNIEVSPNLKQIKLYRRIFVDAINTLSVLMSTNPLEGLAYCRFGLEIPMGTHQGAAAKVDRMLAAAFLAVIDVAPPSDASHHWDVYEFLPAEIKFFISGSLSISLSQSL